MQNSRSEINDFVLVVTALIGLYHNVVNKQNNLLLIY